MRVFLDNVNIESNSGPNSFGRKLSQQLTTLGHQLVGQSDSPDVQLAFIMAQQQWAPLVQRLDGIYFNSRQDWEAMNQPIKATYYASAAVIYQSEFNRKLTEKYFGSHENGYVINNGTDVAEIMKIKPFTHPNLDACQDVWSCASSWRGRPHKRLQDNIYYFYEHAGPRDILVIAGEFESGSLNIMRDGRVIYAGNLDWQTLISLYKRSKYFIHLAFLDHCPNVVVDARAAGCHIICSSSGGTHEIAGPRSTVIQETEEWDMRPLDLYSPPPLDFSKKSSGKYVDINIETVVAKYLEVMKGVCR